MNFFSKKYWKEQLDINIQKYTLFSIFLSSLFIVPFLYDVLATKKIVLLVAMLASFIHSIFDWIFDLPNYFINDDNSNKLIFRIMSFTGTACGFYMMLILYLYEHYPFLKKLIGATWVIEHFNF